MKVLCLFSLPGSGFMFMRMNQSSIFTRISRVWKVKSGFYNLKKSRVIMIITDESESLPI
jgi:hypothetical protein